MKKLQKIIPAAEFTLLLLSIGMLGPIELGAAVWPCFIRASVCMGLAIILALVGREARIREEERAMYKEFGWED